MAFLRLHKTFITDRGHPYTPFVMPPGVLKSSQPIGDDPNLCIALILTNSFVRYSYKTYIYNICIIYVLYIHIYIYTYSIYTYNYMHSCHICGCQQLGKHHVFFSTSSSQLSKMWICQRISRQPKGSPESQGRWWEDVYAVCLHMGLSLNGGTPINGWFISWKIPNKNRWLRGTSILGNPFYPPTKNMRWTPGKVYLFGGH